MSQASTGTRSGVQNGSTPDRRGAKTQRDHAARDDVTRRENTRDVQQLTGEHDDDEQHARPECGQPIEGVIRQPHGDEAAALEPLGRLTLESALERDPPGGERLPRRENTSEPSDSSVARQLESAAAV